VTGWHITKSIGTNYALRIRHLSRYLKHRWRQKVSDELTCPEEDMSYIRVNSNCITVLRIVVVVDLLCNKQRVSPAMPKWGNHIVYNVIHYIQCTTQTRMTLLSKLGLCSIQRARDHATLRQPTPQDHKVVTANWQKTSLSLALGLNTIDPVIDAVFLQKAERHQTGLYSCTIISSDRPYKILWEPYLATARTTLVKYVHIIWHKANETVDLRLWEQLQCKEVIKSCSKVQNTIPQSTLWADSLAQQLALNAVCQTLG